MRCAFRHLLLIFLFLFAQAGGLAHGVSHLHDQTLGDEPVCEQCLAFAPLGAGLTSTPVAWSAPSQAIPHDAPVPVASPCCFRRIYQSRAPPRTC